MASNTFQSFLILSATSALLTACTGANMAVPDLKAENLIGIPLTKNSKLQSTGDDESDKIVVFDKTIKKVHHFDLGSSTHLGRYDVDQPDDDHFLIYGSEKKYFVDLTRKRMNIQQIDGAKLSSGVKFMGTPLSATYDTKKGYLVVYDSLQSVMIYKIDDSGNLTSSFISGPEVKNKGTIQAGDLSAGGKLVLSVRGIPDAATGVAADFIVIIDIEAAIVKQTLNDPAVMTQLPSSLTEMSWVAPVRGFDNLMMIKSKGNISLMNLDTLVVTSLPTDDWVVEKYSKTKDAHVLMRRSYSFDADANGNIERRLYYVDGGVLKTKILTKNFHYVLNSHLDLKRGYWSVTKATTIDELDLNNTYLGFKEGRSFSRIRISDLLTIADSDIDKNATVEIANDYLFSLYPSPMGYATRTEIDTTKVNYIRNFNVQDLQ